MLNSIHKTMEQIFSKAWEYFKTHWKFLSIVSAIGVLVPMMLIMIPMMSAYVSLMASAQSGADNTATLTTLAGSLGVLGFIGIIITILTQVGLMKSALIITKGGTPETRDLFLDFGTYLKGFLAMLLCGIAMAIGMVLCVVPGIIVAFFSVFVPFEILDNPQVGVIDAIKNSVSLVKSDWKTTLIVMLVGGIGASILSWTGVGVILAYPILFLAYSVLYRQLKGQETTPQIDVTSQQLN